MHGTIIVKQRSRGHHLDHRIDQILALEPPAIDNENPDDDLLTTMQVAAWLGVSKEFLEVGRTTNPTYGPPSKRLGWKAVRYRRGSVKTWLLKRKRMAMKRKEKRKAA